MGIFMIEKIDASMPAPGIGVAAVVFNDNNAVLLICRNKRPACGQWSIPGGRLEPGESIISACRREVKEETGLDVNVQNILAVVERRVESFHYVIIDFMASLLPTSPIVPIAQTDVSDARWVYVNELGELDLVDGLLEIVMRAYEYYKRDQIVGLIDIDGKGTDFVLS